MSEMLALFQAVCVNALETGNRVVVAPMTRISATLDGMATERMAAYYERFAAGGFGLIITEGIYTDRCFAQCYRWQPGIAGREQALAWRTVVDAVHAAGGKIFAQLMHAGALSQENRFGRETVGPSAIQPRGEQLPQYAGSGPYRVPRVITEAEIRAVIDGFAQSAQLAIDVARFDGIEIHGANGYLLDQFLTPYTNRRTDRWGGDVRNRLRISMEVAAAIRDCVGRDVPVGIRISQAKVNDFAHKWAGADEASQIFRQLALAPLDFIHVTEYEAWRPAFAGGTKSLASYACQAAPRLQVISNGGLHDPRRAIELLKHGADLISLGRGALANPDWPSLVTKSREPVRFDPAILAPLANIKDVELSHGCGKSARGEAA
jgi:2,4-dienoyl-CoA reductase-like NADH-dependent reductase (Old Yellow Enzyme family)